MSSRLTVQENKMSDCQILVISFCLFKDERVWISVKHKMFLEKVSQCHENTS